MDEEVVAHARHGGEGGQPALVLGVRPRRSPAMPPFSSHSATKVPPGPLPGRDPKRWGQQEGVVVADQGQDGPTALGSLALQAHDQIDDGDAVRAAIDQVAHEPERAVGAGPGVIRGDKPRRAEQAA